MTTTGKASLENLAKQKLALAKRDEDEKRMLKEQFEGLRKDIREGRATTGDRVHDFYIVALGVDDHTSLPLAQKLEADLKGKTGQLVLLLTRHIEGCGTHTFGQGWSDEHLVTDREIGILADDKLILDTAKRKAFLPTNGWVFASGSASQKYEGPLELAGHMSSYGISELSGHSADRGLEVIVGDEAVFAHKPDRHFYRGITWDMIVRYSARLLGKDVPLSEAELEAREEDRKEILGKLGEERNDYAALQRRIKAVEADPRYAGDEAFVAPYGKAKESLARLRELVAGAEKLGIGDDPLVQLVRRELPPEKK
jgi:hypothetical protein